MSESPRVPTRVFQLARRVRWIYVLEAARWLYAHGRESWQRLTPRERSELGRIVGKARGGPGAVTQRERDELRRIVMKALGIKH